MSKSYIVPALAAARELPYVEERFAWHGRVLTMRRPQEPGVLLDLDEVHAHYERDQYMPYWATLWPSAKHLARFLLGRPVSGATRALELGCGLGLSGIAAMTQGTHLTFTDYDESALEWAALNARLNGGSEATFRCLALDLRHVAREPYDLVLASDVIYEARNIEPLVQALTKTLAPDGVALVADQNRPYGPEFLAALAAGGLAVVKHAYACDPAIDPEASGVIYEIRRARRAQG